jgi:hypothetical protein
MTPIPIVDNGNNGGPDRSAGAGVPITVSQEPAIRFGIR